MRARNVYISQFGTLWPTTNSHMSIEPITYSLRTYARVREGVRTEHVESKLENVLDEDELDDLTLNQLQAYIESVATNIAELEKVKRDNYELHAKAFDMLMVLRASLSQAKRALTNLLDREFKACRTPAKDEEIKNGWVWLHEFENRDRFRRGEKQEPIPASLQAILDMPPPTELEQTEAFIQESRQFLIDNEKDHLKRLGVSLDDQPRKKTRKTRA